MEYLPSKKFGYADGLSRLICKYKEPLEDTVISSLQYEGELKTTLYNTVSELLEMLEQIKQEALCDEYINQKKHFFLKSSELRTSSLYAMYRECVEIPSTLQKRKLKDFHAGYSGSTWIKSLMRCYVPWSNMDKDTENAVKLCKGCAMAARAPPIKFNPWPIRGLEFAVTWPALWKDITTSL